MTEQYRNGSDDDDFFLPRQHTAMKRISFFYPPFPSPFPTLLLLPKEKEKLHFHHLLNPTQSNRSPKYHHLEAKRKKKNNGRLPPFPSLPFGRTYLTYLAPILSPPYSPFTEIRLSLSLSKPLQVPMSSEVVDV